MSKNHGSESAVPHRQSIKEGEMGQEKEAPRKLSRRQFVKGAAVGGAGVAAVGVLASCAPAATPAPGETAAPAPTCPPAEESPPAETPWLPAKWDYECDVVVVGYGFAGQAAAIEANDNGSKVIVLEKAPREHWGGSSTANLNYNSATIGTTVEADDEFHKSMCFGVTPDAVIHAKSVAEHELPAWFESLGGTIVWSHTKVNYPLLPGAMEYEGTEDQNNRFAVDEPAEFRQMQEQGLVGSGFQEWMNTLAADRGIEIMGDTPATELIQDPATKAILGVKALTGVTYNKEYQYSGGEEIYIKANKGVVLACGGYENNEEMIKNFVAEIPHSAMTTFYGGPYNTGDGVRMAQGVGAKLWHMNKKEVHAHGCAAAARELWCGIEMHSYGSYIGEQPGIVVNRDGKRFENEYYFRGHSDAHRKYPEFEHMHMPQSDYEYSDYRNVPAYWIFDDTTMKAGPLTDNDRWVKTVGIYSWSDDNLAEVEKGWIIKADTIEELGNKIEIKNYFGEVVGLDAAALAETVRKYNQYCAAGKDEDFGRRPETLLPIVTPPFYAMEVIECQTNTNGGAERNEYSQCLDVFGNILPRLYSAGEFGSIYGFIYNGGGNIAECGASGRIAGKHAASLEPWDA